MAREAREVSGRNVFVAGAIGPLAEVGCFEEGDLASDFREQAELLEARGVDLFVLETFFDIEELVTAVEAVRSVSSLPIVAMLTFDERCQTPAGVSAEDACARLDGLGIDLIGANCGTGPRATLEALRRVNPRNNPTAEDIAYLHEVHAQHEAEMGRPERAAAAQERARRSRRLNR